MLDAWDEWLPKFVKVIPRDYQRMLAAIARAEEQGLVGDEAVMVAFEELCQAERPAAVVLNTPL